MSQIPEVIPPDSAPKDALSAPSGSASGDAPAKRKYTARRVYRGRKQNGKTPPSREKVVSDAKQAPPMIDEWGCEITLDRRELILESIRGCPDYSVACDRVGITLTLLHQMMWNDPDFKAKVDEAWEHSLSLTTKPVVDRLLDYARNGMKVTRFYQGKMHEVTSWNPDIALKILGRIDPRFGEKPSIVIDNRKQSVAVFAHLADAEDG